MEASPGYGNLSMKSELLFNGLKLGTIYSSENGPETLKDKCTKTSKQNEQLFLALPADTHIQFLQTIQQSSPLQSIRNTEHLSGYQTTSNFEDSFENCSKKTAPEYDWPQELQSFFGRIISETILFQRLVINQSVPFCMNG